MQLPKRQIKTITSGTDARLKFASGAQQMADAVGSTFGPGGYNVILGMPYGDATLTRDGVTVAKRTILEDRVEDNAAQILRQASEKTNRTVGDGTSATIVLGNYLFQFGNRLIAAGENGMLLKRQISDDAAKVIEYIKSKSAKADRKKLLQVATVSAGDPNIGAIISDLVDEIGEQGGVTIREHDYPVMDVEKISGYYFDKGFFALNQEIELNKPLVFVSMKRLENNADILPMLDAYFNNAKDRPLVVIAECRTNSEAMNTILLNIQKFSLNIVVVQPPLFNEESKLVMEDIALYAGARLYTEGDDIKEFKFEDFGESKSAKVSQTQAILFGGSGAGEDIAGRAASIKDQIDKETNSHAKDRLEQRYSKLTGKVAIVNVGGSTLVEMEELHYRVEDALGATRAAVTDGVLPGGATILVRAADELELSNLFKGALNATFCKLMENAAERAEYRLEQVRRAPFGYGFNLRNVSDDPIDLREEGIFDATKAIVQVVENATSAAGSLLTANTSIDPIEHKEGDTVFDEPQQ
jgi:chaperonin GroEL